MDEHLMKTPILVTPSNPTFNPAPWVGTFLSTLDQVTDLFGLNVPPIVNLDVLRSLPSGSFGRAWADHLDALGLSPLSTGVRLKQIHDGVHVLTGYDTTPIGEAQVQLFLLGSKFRLRHILLALGLAVPIYRYLQHRRDCHKVATVWKELVKAYQCGQQTSFDIETWHPELTWHLWLADVRSQLGIVQS
jgi:ubiquinone biosynthesis protein Coq4